MQILCWLEQPGVGIWQKTAEFPAVPVPGDNSIIVVDDLPFPVESIQLKSGGNTITAKLNTKNTRLTEEFFQALTQRNWQRRLPKT